MSTAITIVNATELPNHTAVLAAAEVLECYPEVKEGKLAVRKEDGETVDMVVRAFDNPFTGTLNVTVRSI